MKFSFPVEYTVAGWIEIEAEDIAAAKKKAKRLDDEGIEFGNIQDSDTHSTVFVDEGEEIKS